MPAVPRKPWWEEPPSPRKRHRDEIEEAEVKAVVAELPPAQCDAAKAYLAGVDTALMTQLLTKDRLDLLGRLLEPWTRGRS